MAKDIKQRIVLEGEQQYKQALQDARRNLRTLRSELKAETAELGANATAQQKNEAKVKSLKAQIKEQEQIVKTYRAALAEVKEKYSDNADEIAKWETKLNDARTSLANMNNELQKAGSGLDSTKSKADMATVATKSVADALGDIANVGNSVSTAIEGVFEGMISKISEMVGDMYELIVETAGKANGWADTAEFWGTDATTIQQWEHAVRSAHNEFSSMTNVMTRLTLGGKDKEVAEYIGLSSNGYTNMWDFGIAAMDQLQVLKNTDLDKYYEAMEKIFGSKKAVEVMDLVNDWSDIKGNLGTFNAEEGGFGLKGDEIQYMSTLMTDIDTIKEKWIALQDMFATKLATITADLLVYVNGGLDGLNEYFNADTDEERQAALDKIRQNVEGFFTKVVEIIRDALRILGEVGRDLQQSDDPLTRMVGDILVNLTNALQWLVDNQEAVKGAFGAIFGAWLLGQLAAVAGKLGSILMQIEAIKAFKGIGTGSGLGQAAGAGGSGGGSAAAGAGAGAAKSSWLSGLFGAGSSFSMSGGMSVLGPMAAFAAAGIAGAKGIEANLKDALLNQVYGDENGNVFDKMSEASWRQAQAYWQQYSNPEAAGSEAAMSAREALYASLEADGIEMAEQAVSLMENTFDNVLNETDPDGLAAQIAASHPEFFGLGSGGDSGLLNLTPDQRAAAEAFWDIYRKGDFTDDEWNAYEGAFAGNEDLFNQLEALIDQVVQAEDNNDWRNMENLPAEWFMNSDQWNGQGGTQLTSGDLSSFRGLPGQIAAAAKSGTAEGVSRITVSLDGYTVGRLVAPYVSQQIARDLPV